MFLMYEKFYAYFGKDYYSVLVLAAADFRFNDILLNEPPCTFEDFLLSGFSYSARFEFCLKIGRFKERLMVSQIVLV